MKKVLFFMQLLFTVAVCAQPVITTFTPESGAIGSSVTITGTGFNTTAAQNIVFFGATQATVTAATSNSLTVTVPLGATYQYLSVTNLAVNLTAYSAKPFIVTLAGTIAFANKVEFATGTNPQSVSIGDLDGDGKSDLAVTNPPSNTISVLRNTSTIGNVSFATKVDFATSYVPISLNVRDIDGDGKPDLVVVNRGSHTVSVLRNTSTFGTLSFAAISDFATGIEPQSVSIGDIDGDGKPDLVVTNLNSNTVSVLRNTSTPGIVNFETKVDLLTGDYHYSVCIGDIDGDSKPDLAVTNSNSSSVSVLRNTSTMGTISFETKVDFATSNSPISISIGDLDGDGKPDLATANFADGTVSVLRNTSTLGTVNFATKVDFALGTISLRLYSIGIGDINGDGKLDLAVVNYWGDTISVLRNTSTIGTVNFATNVDFATSDSPNLVGIGDLDGDGKPDLSVATGDNNSVSVYRQISHPTISSFSPTSGCANTASVVITGTNFTGANAVTFGGSNALSYTVDSATQITATVASGTTGSITVTTPDGSATSSSTFTVNAPPLATITGSPTFCAGSSTTLSAPTGAGLTYCWQNVTTPLVWQNVGLAGFSAGTATNQSLAFSNGSPYVAYSDGANGNKTTVKKFDGGSWVTVGAAGFSAGGAAYQSLAFDGGTPYVAYRDQANGGKTTVKKFDGSNWVTVGIDGLSLGEAYWISLAINAGTPYVAYYDYVNAGRTTVMKYDGSTWVSVGTAGFSASTTECSSLAFYGSTPYVAFRDYSVGSYGTTVMKFNGTNWVNVGSPGFSAGSSYFQSLAFDGSTPYVAFKDYYNGEKTTVMKFNGSAWVNVGSAGLSAGSAAYQSIVCDGGIPYVAYQDNANGGKTTVKKFNGSAWVNVGSAGFSAGGSSSQSLAFYGGIPYVAYSDGGNGSKTTVMKFDVPPCEATSSNKIVNTAGTYVVTVSNAAGCSATSTPVNVTITPDNTVSTASSSPFLCSNTVLTAITHTTTGASGIGTPIGLPTGVTASWASNTITISGTPIVSGIFNYSIPLTGGCGIVNATGTIIVDHIVSAASSTPTLCINTPLAAIMHSTIGAIGIGTPTGLPPGLTASWVSNTITISGTPTATGTFNYSIPLTGGCASVNAIGTITVNASPTATITGNLTFCVGSSTTLSAPTGAGLTYCWQNVTTPLVWQNVGLAGFSAGGAAYQSLALSNGTPYVAYSDGANGNKTTVKKFDGGSWVNVGSVGFSAGSAAYQSLAFDGSTPYVAYRDEANGGKVTVKKFDGSNWVTVGTVGFSAGQIYYSSLAINAGTPYVAYRDDANGYRTTVMKFDGINWVVVGVAGFSANGGAECQILAFYGNTPYVAYADYSVGRRATVMKFNGTNWVNVGSAGFSAGSSYYQSLAFDGSTPYVAFQDGAFGNRTTVMKFNGSTWVNVGSAGFSADSVYSQSIVCDGGIPYIAYQDNANGGKTTVKKFNGSNWVNVGSAGFSAGSSSSQSLAFYGGIPYVAYSDGANGGKTTVMKFDIPCESTSNNFTVNVAGTYLVKVTNATGCSASSTVSVTETPNSTPTVTLTSTDGDNTFAYGTPVTFTATEANIAGGTVSYDFRVNGTSVQNGASNTYAVSNLANGNQVGVVITITGGTCLTTSTAASNTITNTVTGAFLTSITTYCGQTLPFINSGIGCSVPSGVVGTLGYRFKVKNNVTGVTAPT
ncbi:beta strand repeat-containing protein, partial [Flavobacterium sp. RSB2_4_14]|uniref:beta strand repeat-containing protein n=1 Tax=Flavobacterium sp. RSB2_4_14 TaxID=3447665 RepID=UPI003F367A34